MMVEMGRVAVNAKISILASQLALPIEGNLDAVFHIFAYLKQKYNSCLVLDTTHHN